MKRASLMAWMIKNLPAMQETWVQSLGGEDPLEKGMATRSSILAWEIPWRLKSLGSQRVGHDYHFHFLSQYEEASKDKSQIKNTWKVCKSFVRKLMTLNNSR